MYFKVTNDRLPVDIAGAGVVEADKSRAGTLGTIRVEVFQATRSWTEDAREKTAEDPDLVMAEKALKGKTLSHGTA